MMLGHHLCHHFNWALVIKTLARPNIEFVRDCVQLLLTNARQIRPPMGKYWRIKPLMFSLLPRSTSLLRVPSPGRSSRPYPRAEFE